MEANEEAHERLGIEASGLKTKGVPSQSTTQPSHSVIAHLGWQQLTRIGDANHVEHPYTGDTERHTRGPVVHTRHESMDPVAAAH